ncbi:odorant receptor 131-2-like [Trichomycterus rosablanca]|uniref:odorant receptor 131-2-like n=1 Tax=Trichomycterus rosablanca TaxID=2290929 RepID=UPI002F358251
MNASVNQYFQEIFTQNFIIVFLGLVIICINSIFVLTFFKSPIFINNPRYILYIHLVINDMIMVWITVTLFVMAYAWQNVIFSFCCPLLIIASTTQKNTPLNLAAMALERYIAICKPLHHPQICTVRRTYFLIFFIWIAGIIPPLIDLVISAILFPLFIYLQTVNACAAVKLYNTDYHYKKNMALNVIYTSFVWIVLVYTYCRVLFTAKKMSSDKVSAKKAQSTILLHGVQQLLCMLSYTTPVIDLFFARILPDQLIKISFYAYLLTNIVPRLLSPLIYGVRDQAFAKHLRKNVSCTLCVVKIESAEK